MEFVEHKLIRSFLSTTCLHQKARNRRKGALRAGVEPLRAGGAPKGWRSCLASFSTAGTLSLPATPQQGDPISNRQQTWAEGHAARAAGSLRASLCRRRQLFAWKRQQAGGGENEHGHNQPQAAVCRRPWRSPVELRDGAERCAALLPATDSRHGSYKDCVHQGAREGLIY